MRLSQRMEKLPPYLFVQISRTIAQLKAQGHDVISLGIGDPDIPTPKHVLDAMWKASQDPVNHRYPETEGLPEFRQAVAEWYRKRFNLTFDPATEVLTLIGSKEGLGHVPMCLLNQGDIALVPDPCYPVYPVATMFAGGEPYYLPLKEENGFYPDLDDIPEDVRRRAKMLWINYPNNPTAAVATPEFYKQVVEFAQEYDIAVCHDAAYTEVAFDGYQPTSFLEVPGARDVGIEFHSLSKSYNMTGWRIGMAVGNAKLINALMRFKSNLDSGAPQAIQQMAIAAMNGPQGCIPEHNRIYQARRDRTLPVLQKLGLRALKPKASLYIWARVPEGYTSASFATKVLEEAKVVVTPGTGYGAAGEGYIRISLTIADKRLDEALDRLSKMRL